MPGDLMDGPVTTPREILYGEAAKRALAAGASKLARAVRATLGPAGRNVVIEREYGPPLVTKDGVTVAREIELPDRFENAGARLLREAAQKTAELAGDGTTTATVLAEALYREGLEHVSGGANAIEVKRGLERGTLAVADALKALSRPVSDERDVARVATISANNDAEIGNLVADAFRRVGREGVITVEEGRAAVTTLDVVEGLQFDRGYASPYFVTDSRRLECVLNNPFILVTDRKVSSLRELLPVIQSLADAGTPLLLIADEVEGETLAALVLNKVRGKFQACAVRAPGFGDRRRALLDDIAAATGATLLSANSGLSLADARPEHLGRALRVVVTKDQTTIIGGEGDRAVLDERVEAVRAQLAAEVAGPRGGSHHEIERLRERLATLQGGVAVVRVGGATESEMRERKARIDDAVHATRAALDEGIVSGGGVALVRAALALDELEIRIEKEAAQDLPAKTLRAGGAQGAVADRLAGVRILRRALEEPLRWIAENAGYDGALVVEQVRASRVEVGFDALAGSYTDMYEAGIIDPTKVARIALANACSVAGLLLTTEAAIVDLAASETFDEVNGT